MLPMEKSEWNPYFSICCGIHTSRCIDFFCFGHFFYTFCISLQNSSRFLLPCLQNSSGRRKRDLMKLLPQEISSSHSSLNREEIN